MHLPEWLLPMPVCDHGDEHTEKTSQPPSTCLADGGVGRKPSAQQAGVGKQPVGKLLGDAADDAALADEKDVQQLPHHALCCKDGALPIIIGTVVGCCTSRGDTMLCYIRRVGSSVKESFHCGAVLGQGPAALDGITLERGVLGQGIEYHTASQRSSKAPGWYVGVWS